MTRTNALFAGFAKWSATLLVACAFTLVGMLYLSIQPAQAADYNRDLMYIGLSDKTMKTVFADSTGLYTSDDGDELATLPEGLTWDSSTYTLTMTNWTGGYIANGAKRTDHTCINIRLVGENKLAGGFDIRGTTGDLNAIYSCIPVTLCGSGSLTLDNSGASSYYKSTITAVYIKQGGSMGSSDIFTLKDSVSLNVNWTGSETAQAFYAWWIDVKDSATLEVDVHTPTEGGTVFGYGGLRCSTSSSVVLAADSSTWNTTFPWHMDGAGHITSYNYGLNRNTFVSSNKGIQYNEAGSYGYTVYGNPAQTNYITPAYSITAATYKRKVVTVKEIPLDAPAAGEVPQRALMVKDSSGNREYVADVKWYKVSSGELFTGQFFEESTAYKAVVTLAAMPGYTFQTLLDNGITVKGSVSSTYKADYAEATAVFPATGEIVKPIISTELNLTAPAAGEEAQSTLTGDGFTASVTWTRQPRNNKITRFEYDALYNATIDMAVDSTYTVAGVTASDFTVKGLDSSLYTIDYTEGETTLTVRFTQKTEYRLALMLGNAEYTIDKNGVASPALPEGLSYVAATKTLVMENYAGTSVVSTGYENELNLYLKGANTLTGWSYSSKVIGSSDLPYLGLATYNGDLNIRGDKGASLNIDIAIDSSNCSNGRLVSGICAQTGNASKACVTLYDPDVNVTVVDGENRETNSTLAAVNVDVHSGDSHPQNVILNGAGNMDLRVAAGDNCLDSYCVKGYVEMGSAFTGSFVATGENHASAAWGSNDNTLPKTAAATHWCTGYAHSQKEYAYLNKDVSNYAFALAGSSYAYTGFAIEPAVTAPNKYLVEGTSYTISYSNNVKAGTATVKIAGMGGFSGTTTKTFAIAPVDIANDCNVVISDASFVYNGSTQAPSVEVKWNDVTLSEIEDYELLLPDSKDPGRYQVEIIGVGCFAGTVIKDFEIYPAIFGDSCSVDLLRATYVYNGKAVSPGVVVISDGVKLTQGADYVVAKNSGDFTKVGAHTLKITAMGKYSGSLIKTVVINPAKAGVKSLKVGTKKLTMKASAKPSKKGANRYQIAYRVKGSKTWKYTTTKGQSKKIKKLKTGKRYQIKVRAYKKISGKIYYGAWSKVKTSKKIK